MTFPEPPIRGTGPAPLSERPSAVGQSVSIIIPVHNKSTITRQCLDTLLAEPHDGIVRELVVVDDGSSDATPAMLAGYGDRIRVVRNDTALGFAGACNAGVAAASHDLLVLLNNDTIPTPGWLSALVCHTLAHPKAAVVGVKLVFPDETIQHAGVVFGLDREPHHVYSGFPADHPATNVSRRFQVVTAACALFRRAVWDELGGLDRAYRNGWEDVDFCMRAGERGYEVHYCAESVVYHFESATRDLLSDVERGNRALFARRWREKIVPDDFGYYWADGLLQAHYGARYPIKISVSPQLGGLQIGEEDRLADRILYDRARQVMILLRNNIVLNVRVQEAEQRAAIAEKRLAEALANLTPPPEPEPPGAQPPTQDQSPHDEEPPVTERSDATASSEERPALPHQIVGMVESPGRVTEVVTDGILIVSGWTLTESGKATIEVIINGESRGFLEYGSPRPDAIALYPGFPAGANCGFNSEISVADLPDGFHELRIRVTASETNRAELTTTFEVDNHAYEKGRVIGRLDLPGRGSMYIPRELVTVSGWALAPSGIRSIEAFIDGEQRGRVDHGALRPDIGKRRRQYANADHSGFSGSVPMHRLEPGSHELLVRATANDGQTLEMTTRVEIDSVYTIDGGVPVLNRHYRTWLDKRDVAAATDGHKPESSETGLKIDLLVPLEGDATAGLNALVASLLAQSARNWRLVLFGTETTSEELRDAGIDFAGGDERIVYRPSEDDPLIGQLNREIEGGSADWLAILRPGVALSPAALATVSQVLTATPGANLAYVDNDRVDPESDARWNPFLKPDWSPDLMLAMNYLGPFVLFRREAVRAAGGLREGFPGAEVYDLALRVSESSPTVLHVPEVLASVLEEAPEVDEPWHLSDWVEGERLALLDALQRRGVDATVERGLRPGTWRVRYALDDPPGVTVLMPTGGKMHLLRPCLADLLAKTDYPNLEILLVDNSPGDEVAELAAELSAEHPNIRRITDERQPFNYSALINAAMPHITNPYVLMLNDDITMIDPGWLRAMVEHVQRPEVGIVGAKLLYPDGTIQHAGVVLGPFGGSVHVFKRFPGDYPGYFDLPDVVRNYSAVTFACALIDRAMFEELGGLDEENLPVAFNDTDFCLRAREAGYEVLYTPFATLVHHESVTKTVIAHPHEIGFLRDRWGHVIAHDPYYHPHLTRQGEDARLSMEVTSAA